MLVPDVAIVFAAVRKSSAVTDAARLEELGHLFEAHALREADDARRGEAIANAHEGVEGAGGAHEFILTCSQSAFGAGQRCEALEAAAALDHACALEALADRRRGVAGLHCDEDGLIVVARRKLDAGARHRPGEPRSSRRRRRAQGRGRHRR